MNQKGVSSIVIILIIVGLLVIAGGIWYWQSHIEDGIANWETYRNDKYGFEFEYPIAWGSFVESQYVTNQQEIKLPSGKGSALIKPLSPDENYYFDAQNRFTNSRGVTFYNSSFSSRGGFYWIYAFKNKEEKGVAIMLNTSEDPSGKKVDPEFEKDGNAWLARRVPEFNDLRKIIDSVELTTIIPDETADWQTYRNEEYGFEFKYPLSFEFVKPGQSFLENEVWLGYFDSESGQLSITVEDQKLDSMNIYGTYGKKNLNDLKTLTVDNKTAYMFTEADAGCGVDVVNIPLNNSTLKLRFSYCEEQNIESYKNQILSTFKFTK